MEQPQPGTSRREEMELKIVKREAFALLGLLHSGKNESNEIPQLWEALGPRFSEIPHVAVHDVAYGVCDNFDEGSGTFDYLAGFEVKRTSDLPVGMVRWQVPGATYAVFTCTLPTLGETHARIHSVWLPESGYKRAPGPEFELYDEGFDPGDPDSRMDIYIPVQPVAE
jgi:AraC family transcriptional regulator